MEVTYTASFVRMLNDLPTSLQEEALAKIDQFSDQTNHKKLKVHKLGGSLRDCYSFSVNYHIRIVFTYSDTKPKEALLHAIGDHDVYDT